MRPHGRLSPPLGPVLAVWGLAALTAVAVFATYSRIPPDRLYHVTGEGLEGGASRVAVLLGFPVAVLALPLLPVVVDRLRRASGVSARERAAVQSLALVAAALCATVVVSVDQGDLDVRPVNALAATGTMLSVGLTVYALRRTGMGHLERPFPRGAAAIVVVLALAGLPWVGADIGFSLGRVPILDDVFNSGEDVVHLGHHHGLDGVLLAIAAILLWPSVASMASSRLRSLATFLVALELVYGLANMIQDGWYEQVFKRGWSETDLPSVLHPSLTPAWAGILLVTAVIGLLALVWLDSPVTEEPSKSPG